MSPRQVKALSAVVLLAVITFIWDYLASLELPEGGWESTKWPTDLVRYYYPVARYQGAMLASGALPFWNPWQLAGFPLLAAPAAGILYPPLIVLTLLLPAEVALEVHAVSHLFIGGAFIWLLLRRLQVGPVAALLGSFAFAVSDEMLRETEITSYLSTEAWIPGIFWAILALIDEPRFRRALVLALILTMSFLGGHAQGLLYGMFWAVPFGVAGLLWRAPDNAARLHVLGWLVPAALLTILFSAPQLFPSLELMFDGSRSQDPLTPWQAAFGSSQWQRIWNAITTLNTPGALFGYPALLLALWGAVGLTERWARLTILSLAVLAFLYMQGQASPVWWFFYDLPFGKSFRGPGRIAPLLVFLVAVLAGLGAQNLIEFCRRLRPGRSLEVAAAGIVFLLILGDALWFGPPRYQYQQLRQMDSWGVSILGTRPPALPASQRTLLLPALHFGTLDRQVKTGMTQRRPVLNEYEPILPQPYLDFFNKSGLWHGDLKLEREAGGNRPLPEFTRILDLMGVDETIAFGKPAALAAVQEAKEVTVQVDDVWITKRRNALPRAFVVYQTLVESDPEKAREKLLGASFRPRTTAIVANGEALLPVEDFLHGQATIENYEEGRVDVRAVCGGPCLLVLTDLFDPGWEAWVGEREVPIVKTNIAFRGIRLPAGAHQVEFQYRPASFRWGMILFLGGVVLALFGLWRDRSSVAGGS